MTRNVITVRPNALVIGMDKLFEENVIHHLPVTDEQGYVKGVISKLDYHMILDQFTRFSVKRADESNAKFLGALIASDIMTTEVSCVHPNDSIELATQVFLDNRFHCLPVLQDNKLVGIVTNHDVLAHYYKLATTVSTD